MEKSSFKTGFKPVQEIIKILNKRHKTKTDFFIAAKDLALLKSNKIHRLMDCLNFVKKGKEFVFVSKEYEDYKKAKNKGMIIHWLPVEEKAVKVEVLMEDNTKLTGVGEHRLKGLKKGEIIQFERAFFAKLDRKEKKLVFWFLHR